VHLQPVQWRDDWPVMGEPVDGQTYGKPVTGGPVPVVVATAKQPRLQDSDEFSSTTLGLQWEWNHNPVDAAWSLAARPGWLRLRALPAGHLVTSRNTLTQILQGPAMTTTARVDIAAMSEGQRAGLAMFGSRPSWIGAVREQGITRIVFSAEGVETTALPTTSAIVQLRVRVGTDQRALFAYSLDEGAQFTELGQPTELRFAWWKGARPALFTYVKSPPGTAALSGHVDVDWVRVKVER
jgi:beta-xylosidase